MNMLHKRFYLFFISFLLIASNSAFAQESVLLELGDDKITSSEFKRVYLKNNSGDIIEKSTVDEYLDLYVNFKLKVKEAEARGYDTAQQFINELAGYRKQLAQPYLSADAMIEKLKKEAYERLKEEIWASHILIASKPTDSPEDTLAAFNKAKKAKKKLDRGESFESVALQFSDDPSVKANKGDLGYFTAFHMVYPFETAAYNTKKGEISEIAKTRFGYHILKVNDRRPNSGEITVAHILISTDPEIAKEGNPEEKIREIYERIKNGESFEEMATQFSDDTKSAQNGGVLPIFGVGRMVREFEDAAFALQEDGDISEPFQTQFGWHIVKRIKLDKMGTYEEIEPLVESKVKKDSRSKLSHSAVQNDIKKQYGFTENMKEVEDFYSILDSSYFNGQWSANKASKLTATIFKIGDKEVKQSDFANYLEQTMRGSRPLDFRVLVNDRYKQFREMELFAYKDKKLEEEYPEFKALIEEYHDGILLFNLTDDLVWKKASEDTTGLQEFFEKNKKDYQWKKRADAVIYTLKNEEISSQVKKLISKGLEADSIMKLINESSQLNLRYEKKIYEEGTHPLLDEMDWKKEKIKEFKKSGRVQLVHIKEVLEPGPKKLSEARGLVISDYQEYLEKEWIKELRGKYDFKVDEEVLKQLKSELD